MKTIPQVIAFTVHFLSTTSRIKVGSPHQRNLDSWYRRSRLLLSQCSMDDDIVYFSRDISQAFVQFATVIKRSVYVRPPPVLKLPSRPLLNAERPLYGRSETALYWFKTYHNIIGTTSSYSLLLMTSTSCTHHTERQTIMLTQMLPVGLHAFKHTIPLMLETVQSCGRRVTLPESSTANLRRSSAKTVLFSSMEQQSAEIMVF